MSEAAHDRFVIRPGRMTLADMRRIFHNPVAMDLNPDCIPGIEAAARAVADFVARGETAYAVTTGFGKLADTRIEEDDILQLQINLLRSHAAGTGPLLDDDTVRLIVALKANGLARGFSGIAVEPITLLLRMVEAGVYPCVPSKGSVGASGDLAPLAHLVLPLIGEGQVRFNGDIMPAADGLKKAGLAPVTLGPKAGLALINGTQVSTALALKGLFAIEHVYAAALVAGAMTADAVKGSDTPFDDRIHALRGHRGQAEVARVYKTLLAGSGIRESHMDCDRVQDPYSIRCQPQVMGACLDQMRHAAGILEIEANAVSDNPLVFADSGEILSGGNFHAEPVAMVADNLAVAVAETGALSERRVALMMDSAMSELPPFLIKHSGLNSGFMIAQVTAAALASENKPLAHPASVDSLPTSANQEDHVSMATHAARRLGDMAENTAGIVAVELLCAAQGIDFRAPLSTSDTLAGVIADIRKHVPTLDNDREMAPDIQAVTEMVLGGAFTDAAAQLLPSMAAP